MSGPENASRKRSGNGDTANKDNDWTHISSFIIYLFVMMRPV